MTAAALKLKARVKDAEENSGRIGEEPDYQRRAVGMAVSEKVDLMEAVASRDTEIKALQAEISKLVWGRGELARDRLELVIRCVQPEEEKDRWEEDKLNLLQEIEEIKIKPAADLVPLEELKVKHSELAAEHEEFSKEHAAALERSKLYDIDEEESPEGFDDKFHVKKNNDSIKKEEQKSTELAQQRGIDPGFPPEEVTAETFEKLQTKHRNASIKES